MLYDHFLNWIKASCLPSYVYIEFVVSRINRGTKLYTIVKFVYRILHWDDTVVYNGKKIDPVNVKREKGQGGSDDEVT